ncbi:putative inactive serine/threonine-protein kinase slob1 isoform X1 [Gossypium australe]|uniref:Putative inactive serine/threonine-protein kinase slob1 isoform X1 n=1 Tax=Gossypium australe TaxID=47621 RepID=A0A5B6UVD0_9ROSI|nr:putative inactive serine/threonine-protein kinase slob1 isoform X1 [Gossypium australe]
MSMPHTVVDHTQSPPPLNYSTTLPPPSVSKKQPSKFSRSILKLFKSVFKFRQSSSHSVLWLKQRSLGDYFVVYDKTGALTTIPEVPEIDFGGLSPEINSLVVERSESESFTAASTVGISCA